MPFLLINKEEGWTSHDVVGYLRKVTKIKKIGHAGTLDPFATGLLIVGIEREATKRLDEFKGMKKVYEAVVQLGAVSDTYDKTGVVEATLMDTQSLQLSDVKTILPLFVGEQNQIPPMYSAKKVGGQKLYELARQGIEIERKPHHIFIENIKILTSSLGRESPSFSLEVTCSAGTYIRTLVHDIGQKLGVGAYCEELKRTSIGNFSLEKAVMVKELTQENWKNFTLELPSSLDKEKNT